MTSTAELLQVPRECRFTDESVDEHELSDVDTEILEVPWL